MVNRVLKYGLVVAACALPALLGTTPANAISWGEKGRDGKVCRVLLVPHFHFGFGSVKSTKSAARSAAIKRWSSFATWEYGRAWGRYGLAKRRSVHCARSLLGGWRCIAIGQPCRS